MKISKYQMRIITSAFPSVKTEADVHALTDAQLSSCPNIGKMFIYHLRQDMPKTDNEIWNNLIDHAIVAVTRKLNALKK